MSEVMKAEDGSWTLITDDDGVVSIGVVENHLTMLAQDRHGPETALAVLSLAEVNMFAAALEEQRRRMIPS